VKLIIDVGYQNNKAKVVGGFFEDWNANQLLKLAYKEVNEVQEYIPGEFYKIELPKIVK
jgi:deoxyinosine 3'endonuclease (endonuclease V)